MEIIRNLKSLGHHPYPVATVGNFDGLHLGHHAILRAVIDRARTAGGTAFAITFDPLPAKFLFPDRAPDLIMVTCSFSCWCMGTTAPCRSRSRAIVIRSV